MTQELNFFWKIMTQQNWALPINMTHRMEPFFSIWLKELNPFRNITQRTEPFSTYDSQNWTFFSIELFEYDSNEWIFSICFEELNPFLIWPKKLTFGKMSQIFEPFLNMTQRIDFFHTIQIIEPYFENWLTELNFLKLFWELSFFQKKKNSKNWKNWTLLGYHSKDWTFFCWTYDSKNLNFFSQFDSKNCSNLSFSWFKYLDLFHMTQRIEPSYLRDSNTWIFFENFWFKEMDLFFSGLKVFHQSKMTHRIDFFESDPQNWFLWIEPFNFLNMTQRIEPFNFLNMTQRFELFDQYDSKN